MAVLALQRCTDADLMHAIEITSEEMVKKINDIGLKKHHMKVLEIVKKVNISN